MLIIPIRFTDLLEGKITPQQVWETKSALEKQGERIQYAFDYDTQKVWGEYVRCRGCGNVFEWNEMIRRGGKEGDRRNQCRDCYAYYWYFTQADKYKSLGRHTAKERQRQLAHDLYGGRYWSYMLETPHKTGKLLLYFGATDNMISRKREHFMLSSNPETRDLFDDKKSLRLKDLFVFVRPITFNVWAHDTIEEAYRHERKRWEFWLQREDVEILNGNEPPGVPPKNTYNSDVVNKEQWLNEA